MTKIEKIKIDIPNYKSQFIDEEEIHKNTQEWFPKKSAEERR